MPRVVRRVVPAVWMGVLIALSARAQPVPTGPAFDLTGSASGAILPAVERAPRGGYLVAWYVFRAFPNGIAARALDGDGGPVGAIWDVWRFATSAGAQSPAIAADAAGEALIAWSDGGVYAEDILVRQLDPLGRVHVASGVTAAQDDHPAIVAGAPGRFLVVWSSGGFTERDILARWVDDDGQPLGDAFRVNDDMAGYQDGPDVARLADGTVAVVWRHFAGVVSGAGLRVYGPDGAPLGPARLAPIAPGARLLTPAVHVASAPQGFVVGWLEERVEDHMIVGRDVVAHAVSADGASHDTIRVAPLQNVPSGFDLAVDEHGLGVFVWETDLGGEGVRAAAFDVAARTGSDAVFVSEDENTHAPVVAVSGPGRFLVAWSDGPDDGVGTYAVRGRFVSLCGNGRPEPGEGCDDGNRRDGDCCSSACQREPIAGTCWRLAGTSVLGFTASVTRGDVHATCAARCRKSVESTVMLLDDGTYRWPQGTASCADGSIVVFPDEVGRYAGRGERLVLQPRNLRDLRAALRHCAGVRLGGIATTFRRTEDTLRGRQVTRARRGGNPPVSVRTTTRFSGVALDAGRAPEAPVIARGLGPCTDEIRLRCRVGD